MHSTVILLPILRDMLLTLSFENGSATCRSALQSGVLFYPDGADSPWMLPPHSCAPASDMPWLSPAELAGYRTFWVCTPGGFRFPILQYPIGCGFVQSMEHPAVWCAATRSPSPHQPGGGLYAPGESLLDSLGTDGVPPTVWGYSCRHGSWQSSSDDEVTSTCRALTTPSGNIPCQALTAPTNDRGADLLLSPRTEDYVECAPITAEKTEKSLDLSATSCASGTYDRSWAGSESGCNPTSRHVPGAEEAAAGHVNVESAMDLQAGDGSASSTLDMQAGDGSAASTLDMQAAVSLAGPAPLDGGQDTELRNQRSRLREKGAVSTSAGRAGVCAASSTEGPRQAAECTRVCNGPSAADLQLAASAALAVLHLQVS
jgi:hypothetical protein